MIHLVIGRQGSGKTLLLVKMAYESYMRGEAVYSNVHFLWKSEEPLVYNIYEKKNGKIIKDKDGEPIIKEEIDNRRLPQKEFYKKYGYYYLDYNDIVDCKLENGIVIIDEIHLLLPSRNSMSKRNREICDGFLSMVRKRGLEVYGSTQTLRKVDVRFREERDYLYICSKYAYDGGFYEVVQSVDLEDYIKILIHLEVQDNFNEEWVTFPFIGNQYFKLFDTKQIVLVRGLEVDKSNTKA